MFGLTESKTKQAQQLDKQVQKHQQKLRDAAAAAQERMEDKFTDRQELYDAKANDRGIATGTRVLHRSHPVRRHRIGDYWKAVYYQDHHWRLQCLKPPVMCFLPRTPATQAPLELPTAKSLLHQNITQVGIRPKLVLVDTPTPTISLEHPTTGSVRRCPLQLSHNWPLLVTG